MKPRQLARNLALSTASIVLCVALAEGLLILAGFELPDTGYFRRDARLGFVLEPGEYPDGIRINKDGFRGPDLLEWRPGRVRIVTLGDSCTFGVNLPDESQTYPRRLEQLLRNESLDAEVVNAGVPGYTSFQGKLLTAELERLRPDAITVYYGWNDHWLGGFMSDDALASCPILLRLHLLASESRIYQSLKGLLRRTDRRGTLQASVIPLTVGELLMSLERYRVSIEDYQQNLEALRDWAGAQGIRVIFMTVPEGIDPSGRIDAAYRRRGRIKKSDTVATLHAAYNDRVRRVAPSGTARLIDAAEVLRQEGNDFFADSVIDPVHPDAAGHALIAEALAEQLGSLVPRERLE